MTLNRPERLNAWTGEMERDYFAMLEECGSSSEVRVIVVTGAGRGFCAGADMHDLKDARRRAAARRLRRARAAAAELPAVDTEADHRGDQRRVRGIGLVQALMCDLRFAAEGAKLTTAFARRGLVAEHGIAWVLPRLVGPARALDLLLSGRIVLAEEAHALGLVNRVLPPDALLEQTLAYARDLAVQLLAREHGDDKRQVYADLQRELPDALSEADRLMLASFSAPDFVEGVTSFLERRDPRFASLSAR